LPKPTVPRPAPIRRITDLQESLQLDTATPPKMPSLTQSAQAFLHGSHLESRLARAHPTDPQIGQQVKFTLRKETSPEIRQAIGLLRSRQSQRAAIMAGIILGQPKGLET
jgi:hypothetical protein